MAMLWYFTVLLITFGLIHDIEGRECPPGESPCTDGIFQPHVCYNSSRSYCYEGGVVCPHGLTSCSGSPCYNISDSWCYTGGIVCPHSKLPCGRTCYDKDRSWCYEGGIVCPHGQEPCRRVCYDSRISMCRGGEVKDRPSTACDGNYTSGCGCDHGFCYKFKTIPGVAYEPWCWTQQLGVAEPQGNYASCTNHSQCDVQMTCGDGVEHRGGVSNGPTARGTTQQLNDDEAIITSTASTASNIGIKWNGNWAFACDFSPNNDISHAIVVRGEECSTLCASTPECTHFTWNPAIFGGSYCFMKSGPVSKADAFKIDGYPNVRCGIPDAKRACDGNYTSGCGCDHGFCYKFITIPGVAYEPWCWTQQLGVSKPQAKFASCTNHSQCSVQMTCGDGITYRGGAVHIPTTTDISRVKEEIIWTGNRGLACDWPGNDIRPVPSPSAEDCNSQCAATLNCTHFTWTLAHDGYGDTCFLKSGAVQKTHAVISTIRDRIVRAKAVCGLVEEVPEKRSSQFPDSSQNAIIGSLIGGVLLLAVALALIVFVLIRWRKGQARKELREGFQQDNANKGIGFECLTMATMSGDRQQDVKLNSIYSQYTKMLEIAPAKVEISTDVLGKGEFGMVFKGLAHDLPCRAKKATTVAAKTLIGSITPEQTQAFMDEFKIMLKCGHHVNIVNILGVILEGPRPFLLLEFCSGGSLLAYLKRHKISPQPDQAPEEPKHINSYCTETSILGPSASALLQDSLTTDELVQFCYQISRGMEHLASRHIIHRDLAARNILVSDGKILKISDFGLARTGESYMVSNARVALPVLWMPPEAIVSRHFSQKSDVWSFGVLMWELFSLGQVPFDRPEVEKFSVSAFADWLLLGNQMAPPKYSPIPMYETMQSCWRLEADDRPTFTEIRAKLDGFVCKNGNDSSPYLILTGNDRDSYVAFEKLDEEMLSCLQIPSAEARYSSI
ncbi:putative Vascular endothelial growth factor receptor 2 [Hypsibius exemplaris]|uniref:Vascular endothelial growth factor receptor 2 n=1 Tax=Hypsibius exemplaris TaxID=2072580 RepID=A0A1W0WIH9_HYPEX|nr:putative Vascular endothelial growth factor receptor 2 [Hypsibius exemplaris]